MDGKPLQIQYKYYPAPRGLSTTFNTKPNIKWTHMTQYESAYVNVTHNYIYMYMNTKPQNVMSDAYNNIINH